MNIRCSSLPRVLSCPASALAEGPNLSSIEASLGSAVHAGLATAVRENGMPFYRDNYGLTTEQRPDWDYLTGRGMAVWAELRAGLTSYDCELPLEAPLDVTQKLTLSGHIDVLGMASDYLLVVDYKTGEPDISDYWPQMRGYAKLALYQHPEIHQVKAVIAWLRSSEVEVKVFTRKEIDTWTEEVLEILSHQGTYNPGSACRYCPAALDCSARRKVLHAATADLLAPGEAAWTPVQISNSWEKVGLIEKAIERYRGQVKQYVAEHGPIALANGATLALKAQETETLYLTGKAYDLLTTALGGNPVDMLPKGITIGKTKLGEAVKKKAAKGEKGKAIEALLEALRAAGAVSVSKYEVLKARKAGSDDGK